MPRLPAIGDVATLAVPGALALGILVPGAAAAALPLLPVFVAALVFATVMGANAERFVAVLRAPGQLLAAALFIQIALPLAAWTAARAAGAEPALALAAVLLLAAPVGTSGALYVTLAGGNAAISLCLSAITFLALPIVLPLLAAVLAMPAGELSPRALAERAALVILLPAFAAIAIRRAGLLRGTALARAGTWTSLGFAVLLPTTLARSSGIGPMLRDEPLAALAVALLIAGLLLAAYAATALATARYEKIDARGVAVSAVSRNIGVIWAATAGMLPEATEQALALSAIVFYAMPPALRLLARLSPAAPAVPAAAAA